MNGGFVVQDDVDRKIGKVGAMVAAATVAAAQPGATAVSVAVAAASVLVPDVVALTSEKFRGYLAETIPKRLTSSMTVLLLSDRTPDEAQAAASRLADGKVPFTWEVVRRIIEDNEEKKAWAYGALLRAFDDEKVPSEEQPRLLRFVQDNFNGDLVALLEAAETTFVLRELVRTRGFDAVEDEVTSHVKTVLGHAFRPMSLAKGLVGALMQERAQRVMHRHHLGESIKAYGWLGGYEELNDHVVVYLRGILRSGASEAGVSLATPESIKDLAVEQCRRWREQADAHIITAVE